MQGLGDLQHGQVGCPQAAFGLDQRCFVEPFECGVSRYLLDGGRESFGGDAEPVGIEGDLPLRLEVLRHELEEAAGRETFRLPEDVAAGSTCAMMISRNESIRESRIGEACLSSVS